MTSTGLGVLAWGETAARSGEWSGTTRVAHAARSKKLMGQSEPPGGTEARELAHEQRRRDTIIASSSCMSGDVSLLCPLHGNAPMCPFLARCVYRSMR